MIDRALRWVLSPWLWWGVVIGVLAGFSTTLALVAFGVLLLAAAVTSR